MTEQEWLTATDRRRLLEFWRGRASHRNLRLGVIGCFRLNCRRQVVPRKDEHVIQTMEQYADGVLDWEQVTRMLRTGRMVHPLLTTFILHNEHQHPLASHNWPLIFGKDAEERARRAKFVRDFTGNPFRPVTFSPAWRTTTVTNLAQSIYEDRHMPSGLFDNQRMGILADALEDAGCDNRDILEHCRHGGEHVRGCWVIDLVLGKE